MSGLAKGLLVAPFVVVLAGLVGATFACVGALVNAAIIRSKMRPAVQNPAMLAVSITSVVLGFLTASTVVSHIKPRPSDVDADAVLTIDYVVSDTTGGDAAVVDIVQHLQAKDCRAWKVGHSSDPPGTEFVLRVRVPLDSVEDAQRGVAEKFRPLSVRVDPPTALRIPPRAGASGVDAAACK